MITVQTLENMNVHTIYKVFEDAFTGYFVTFEKKPELHIERWLSAGVDFSLSYGVKVDGKLVAFLLHAPCEDVVMNLATGVMREFQGKGFTSLMYEEIFRALPANGFQRARLEVITENTKAIRAYEKSGFQKTRKLLCWKGKLEGLTGNCDDYEIKKVLLTEEHESLTPFPYAFEQSAPVVLRRSGMLELHELRENKKLLAYAVFNPWQMNLVQLGGVSSEKISNLLHHMKLEGENVGMVNVDERNNTVNGVFRSRGMTNYISQYEMETALSRPPL
ncbi:MAG: GNAT family N-acetyltransferase [Bacteriovoracaceae bacterium]